MLAHSLPASPLSPSLRPILAAAAALALPSPVPLAPASSSSPSFVHIPPAEQPAAHSHSPSCEPQEMPREHEVAKRQNNSPERARKKPRLFLPPQPIKRQQQHPEPLKTPTHARKLSSHNALAKTSVGLRELAKKIGLAPLSWEAPPSKVLIVAKLFDPSIVTLTLEAANHLAELGITVYIQRLLLAQQFNSDSYEQPSISDLEKKFHLYEPEFCASDAAKDIDFVVTFGGDGTVLFAAWLFQKKAPPIIPFNLGSLGFLTVFSHAAFKQTIQSVLHIDDGMRMNFRLRFACTVHRSSSPRNSSIASILPPSASPSPTTHRAKHHSAFNQSAFHDDDGSTFNILNDIVVDRGPSPYLSQLELYGNEKHLTTVQADGLVIATPTGSTAYSLSAGGSVVHPDVSAILVTPICPHTLSFRPMILPDTMDVKIVVPSDSRATAWVSFDGHHRVQLYPGDYIHVRASKFPVPTVCVNDQSSDWFNGLETCLAWNRRERQKKLEI